jgi:hypothetical protein
MKATSIDGFIQCPTRAKLSKILRCYWANIFEQFYFDAPCAYAPDGDIEEYDRVASADRLCHVGVHAYWV